MNRKEKRSFDKRLVLWEEKIEIRNTIIMIMAAVIFALLVVIAFQEEKDEIQPTERIIYTIGQNSPQTACIEPKEDKLDELYTFVELTKQPILKKEVEMTFYLPTGNACANCEMPTENHTVAFERSYLNCECDIYTLDGELIGHYTIDDTGYGRTEENGKGTIENANCVDVFFQNETDGRNFIAEYGNQVKVVIYESEEK